MNQNPRRTHGTEPAGGAFPGNLSPIAKNDESLTAPRLDPVTIDRSTAVRAAPPDPPRSTTAVDADGFPQYKKPRNRDTSDKEESKSLWPLHVRARIREATQQVHLLVIERMKHAERQPDAASWSGLEAEVREVARVQVAHAARKAQDGDVRAALVALAASSILLAEVCDRPGPPARGVARATTTRWRAMDFRV